MSITVLVADDEPSLREAFCDLIRSEDGLDLVGSAQDAQEAIDKVEKYHPDVILLDVKMPKGGGVYAAAQIYLRHPKTKILAISAYSDRESVFEMLRNGASGYIVKGAASSELLDSIRLVMQGQSVLSSEVTGEVVGELASNLARERQLTEQLREISLRVNDVRNNRHVQLFFQPIVNLTTRKIVGVEALSRFDFSPHIKPDVFFEEAGLINQKEEMELLAVHRAIEFLDQLPQEIYMSVNLSPKTIISEEFRTILRKDITPRIVLEITEQTKVENYDGLLGSLKLLRDFGGRLAIDDAGAGYSSLRHILQLAPDTIKLDISLTSNIHEDIAKQAMAVALVSFAERLDIKIVAEGIEKVEELEMLKTLGVPYGQGYYFAHPSLLENIAALKKEDCQL